jgi:fatty acid desaturase
MAGIPRGGRRRRRPWGRKAEVLRWAAFGCYLAAVLLVWLTLAWPWGAPLAVVVGIAGAWCQRTADFAGRLEDENDTGMKADVPGD